MDPCGKADHGFVAHFLRHGTTLPAPSLQSAAHRNLGERNWDRMRHGPRHGQHRPDAVLRHWFLTGLLLVPVGALVVVLVGSLFAHPVRPRLSPMVADPAVLAASDSGNRAPSQRHTPQVGSSAQATSAHPSRPAPTRQPEPRPTTRPAPSPTTPRPTPQSRALAYEQQILALANSERARAGCPPLSVDAALRRAAQGHTQDMADYGYFSHTGSDGTSPWDRAAEAGYSDPSGENIAAGYGTPEDVMAAWMASPGHRANILNCDSREMGLGYVATSSRGPLWTQMFGFG